MRSQARVRTCWAISSSKNETARISPGRQGLFLERRFDRQLGLLPSIPTAEEGGRVRDLVSIHVQHRTGARVLVHSSTVGDEVLADGQVLPPGRELGQRDAEGALDVRDVVLLFR